MRRLLAASAALALAATIVLPAAGAAAKVTCDPTAQIPGWESLAYAKVPVGLPAGTHTFVIAYAFTDVDDQFYEGTVEGSFDVTTGVPVVAGTVLVTPWGMLAAQPPKGSYPIWEMNGSSTGWSRP